MACYQEWWQAAFVKAQLKAGPILARAFFSTRVAQPKLLDSHLSQYPWMRVCHGLR
jgi:hypothetical protein